MKYTLFAVALVAGICLAQADEGSCGDNVAKCTAVFSSVEHAEHNLDIFTNQQLEKSFDFLLLSSVFDHYKRDRPGFEKLYRKISDKAWEDTQGLIKYRSKRGMVVQLNGLNATTNILETGTIKDMKRSTLLASDERDSLKLALAYEKKLAEESHAIHKKISHAHGNDAVYDPDVAHYLDEEIIEYQSGVIRELAGHIHNLEAIWKDDATRDLGLHMFDEYLDKA